MTITHDFAQPPLVMQHRPADLWMVEDQG